MIPILLWELGNTKWKPSNTKWKPDNLNDLLLSTVGMQCGESFFSLLFFQAISSFVSARTVTWCKTDLIVKIQLPGVNRYYDNFENMRSTSCMETRKKREIEVLH